MAQGENVYPLESEAGNPLDVDQYGTAAVRDQKLAQTLAELIAVQRDTIVQLEIIADHLRKMSAPAMATTLPPFAVASSMSNQVFLEPNGNRVSCIVFNNSTADLYLLLGAGIASLTNFTYKLGTNVTLELPLVAITGSISGIWSAVNGSAQVTEVVKLY